MCKDFSTDKHARAGDKGASRVGDTFSAKSSKRCSNLSDDEVEVDGSQSASTTPPLSVSFGKVDAGDFTLPIWSSCS